MTVESDNFSSCHEKYKQHLRFWQGAPVRLRAACFAHHRSMATRAPLTWLFGSEMRRASAVRLFARLKAEPGGGPRVRLFTVDEPESETIYTDVSMNVIYGINSVSEALKARGRAFEWVGVAKERHDLRLQKLIQQCHGSSIPVRFLPRPELDRMARTGSHQGVVAVTSSKAYVDLDDVIASKRAEHSLLVVLDGIEDPHNLGAILRTADASGADGVVIPERRAVGITGTVSKASAGASEHLPVAKVTNIARTLEQLKAKGLWTVGLDERGKQNYDQVDYLADCAVVLGGEGQGLHELVRKKCDFLVSIPMLGKVPSLNVAVAAGVVLYEIQRQRRNKLQ
jgi:23S rRNA (guanosine2251-2'-O)-methyltransferase